MPDTMFAGTALLPFQYGGFMNKANNSLSLWPFRIANQRVLELEAQIEDIHEGHQATITTAIAAATAAAVVPPSVGSDNDSKTVDLERQLTELRDECARTQTELEARTLQLDEKASQAAGHNAKVTTLKKSVKDLKDSLERKDDEMRAMEERYRRYLEKAKNVSPAFLVWLYRSACVVTSHTFVECLIKFSFWILVLSQVFSGFNLFVLFMYLVWRCVLLYWRT